MFYSDLLVTAGRRLPVAAARTRPILPTTTVPRAINQQLPREADTSTAPPPSPQPAPVGIRCVETVGRDAVV